MMTSFTQLPIYDIRQKFQESLRNSPAVLITAPTGSGKSTQIPKMLLELLPPERTVLVLQPRRLAARMLAERIAEETGSRPGELVGYQTRYERAVSARTRICFITEGILSRMLFRDPELKGVGGVIFDEFHERNIFTDLGLAMTWHLCRSRRPDLKLVVMSATVSPRPIQEYLGNCPHLASDGRLFPVTVSYARNSRKVNFIQQAAQAVRDYVCSGQPGDILVFMPGAGEIHHCIQECGQLRGLPETLELLPLHGTMQGDAQRKVMEPSPRRKVIIATNIAETSLTIPGIRHVIDSGLCRQNRYDAARGVNILELRPIARDAADQRAGRAGREAPGSCFRLWSELEQSARPSATLPEILRVDLASTLLTVNSFGFTSPRDFPWFEAPPEKSIAAAEKLLRQLGILKPEQGGLTELGRKLLAFPAHPRLALLLHLGAVNGCYEQAAYGAAILSERPLILRGSDNRALFTEYRQRLQRSTGPEEPASDFLAQMDMLRDARNQKFNMDFCQRQGIHAGAARDICRAAEDYLRMKPRTEAPAGPRLSFQQCLLLALPDHLVRRCDQGTLVCELQGRRRANLSRNSLVRSEPLFLAGEISDFSADARNAVKLELSLASGIREEWLWELFPDDFADHDECFYDEVRQQVLRRRTLSCLDLVLEESVRNDAPEEQAAAILTKQIMDNGLHLPEWNDEVEHWIARVRWLAEIFPDKGLPKYDEADRKKILLAYCAGEYAYKKLKSKPCLPYVKALMDYQTVAFVDKMAPTHWALPEARRKMRIEYVPGQPPKGRARIEDLYEVHDAIRVAGGRVPVLLDILAPNMRTVQITDDLGRFWEVHYPAIRSALARRYPRHEWR